jgi:cobalt-zinc-cadmium efflux system outer membrane protein
MPNRTPPPKSRALTRTRWLPVAALLAPLVLGACAGSVRKAREAQAFEQWSRADQGWQAGGQNGAEGDGPAVPADREPDIPADARLGDYVHYALKHHPELAAAFDRWRSALERIPQARTLPDPRVSFGVVLDEVDRSAEYMGERYGLEQMFPWFGKLDLAGDMALSQARTEAERFEALRLEIEDRVSQAYFELAYQQQAAAIARENLDLLLRLETVARTMFRGGTASLSDVNRAQIEIGRLDDQVRALEDLLGVARAELNAALGRPAHAPLPPAPTRPSALAIPDLPDRTDEEWAALARRHNPGLAAAGHAIEEQRQAVSLARKSYFPDISVGLEYGRDASARLAMMDGGGADMVTGTLSVNVPVWHRKYAAGVREAQARLGEARREVESRAIRLEADLKRAHFSHRDSLRKLTLYGDTLLPLARQTLATTETAFRAGQAGFADLIDAQRVLLEFALAHERAAADRAQAVARIQALAGRPRAEVPAGETAVGAGEGERPSPDP